MIYLIGGPPKCGKTTAAKLLLREHGIPWISTDALETIIYPYIPAKKHATAYPHSYRKGNTNDETYAMYTAKEIMEGYIAQSATVHPAIEAFIESERADGNDYCIEGYHITPAFAAHMQEKFTGNVCSAFLVRTDPIILQKDFSKSATPNDWILRKTKKQETFEKIASMICLYGTWTTEEAEKYQVPIYRMEGTFDAMIQKIALNLLSAS